MSISIEKLKFLANGLGRLGNLYISDEAGDCIGHTKDVLTAIRELIAIKEAGERPIHSCDVPGCMACDNPPEP